jgi:hypothetical protein
MQQMKMLKMESEVKKLMEKIDKIFENAKNRWLHTNYDILLWKEVLKEFLRNVDYWSKKMANNGDNKEEVDRARDAMFRPMVAFYQLAGEFVELNPKDLRTAGNLNVPNLRQNFLNNAIGFA